MKLFQYWHTSAPPDDVARWIEGFKINNPEFDHSLFNHESAEVFIAEHYGSRMRAAFLTCAPPAMQADYLRLCLLDTYGGLYVDADNQSLEPLSELIDQAPFSMMFTWVGGLINNGFVLMRSARDPFVRACLELATDNIQKKRFNSIFTTAGPGVLNAVRALAKPDAISEMAPLFDNEVCRDWGFLDLVKHARDTIEATPELLLSIDRITLINALSAGRWVGTKQPAYKDAGHHWLQWKGSIYG